MSSRTGPTHHSLILSYQGCDSLNVHICGQQENWRKPMETQAEWKLHTESSQAGFKRRTSLLKGKSVNQCAIAKYRYDFRPVYSYYWCGYGSQCLSPSRLYPPSLSVNTTSKGRWLPERFLPSNRKCVLMGECWVVFNWIIKITDDKCLG